MSPRHLDSSGTHSDQDSLPNNLLIHDRSFARDGGIPYASLFAKVTPGWDVPTNAMMFTLGITIVLSLFIIGTPNSPAFAILTSLSLTGLISSYLLAVICVFWKRLRGEQFPPGRFNLGKFGFVCNIIAMAFLLIAFIFMFFPVSPNPGAKGMNWSVVSSARRTRDVIVELTDGRLFTRPWSSSSRHTTSSVADNSMLDQWSISARASNLAETRDCTSEY